MTCKFDEGLEAGTVRNYKSAILAVHKGFADGTSLRGDESLRRLLTGMFNDRPPTRPQVPAWDLNTVLRFLSEAPFEPLDNATLKNLTFKTVMLVALASGRRCSEIQAISASASVFVNDGVNLFFRPDFVPKNETSSFKHTPLFLPKIGMHSSVREDRLWCPVRALRKYLQRTSNLRGDNDQLFLTYVEPHRPAAIRTVARWLVAVLVDSKAVDASSHPRAHSTRAVASSWAFHRGVSVAGICESVSWKSASTFSSVYYRNVTASGDRGHFATAVLERRSKP